MKHRITHFAILFFCFAVFGSYAQTIFTTELTGESGVYTTTLTPNEAEEITVNVGPNKCLRLDLEYNIAFNDDSEGDFSLYKMNDGSPTQSVYWQRGGIGTYTYLSTDNSGMMLIYFSGGYCNEVCSTSSLKITYTVIQTPANQLTTTGPILLQSPTTTPNLTIHDFLNKTQLSGRTINTSKSLLLLENDNGQALSLTPAKIGSVGQLELSSQNATYFNAASFGFSSASKSNAVNISSLGYLGIGKTNPSGVLEVYRDENPAIWLSSKTSTSLLAKATCDGCYAPYSKKGDVVLYSIGSDSRNVVLNLFDTRNDGAGYVTFGDHLNGRTMSVFNNGKVTIGTVDPNIDAKLAVKGTIKATQVQVETMASNNVEVSGSICANHIKVAANGQTADFVFDDGYELKDLAEVEKFIQENKHLPNIPNAKDMEANGVDLAEMNKLLLQKVEELVLYAIDKEKEVQSLKSKVETQEERLAKLEEMMQKE